jgi:hypothetical protein
LLPLTQAQADALREINAALANREPEDFANALFMAYTAGMHEFMAGALIAAADADWHQRHEDLALTLQDFRLPASVPVLERLALARHAYLDYDDKFGLARKCTWALADIGTSAARAALERLAANPNAQIAAYAARRLAHWQEELERKRGD